MSIPAAYAAVVIVWSTTPLGVVWSSESVPPVMAALLRMSIAAVVGFIILKWRRIPLPWNKQAVHIYGCSVLGVFGAMLCTYLAAKSISSGLISVIFGLSPLVSGLLAQRILGDKTFTKMRWVATFVALIGLLIVCANDLSIEGKGYSGIALILTAVLLFSTSGVLVKRSSANLHPFATTVGALLLSIPLYMVSMLVLDTPVAISEWGARSLASIVYLALFGSLVGFVSYFYVLQKLSPSTVALVTLITPVFAIILGALLNNEAIGLSLMIGASCIVSGLMIYHWGDLILSRVSANRI
ncbi:DMT family transporter [Alkalimarinus sediminis]|uniref:EamA family transporter n=1 Tax=Alkalimarinus sediminis TaxID=1632866 RepID=A0A9E8HHH5_9ALTE|nr:EamA family transporter [Alkalimarinus sediminis]UZW74760.1 EamA family transporter [Alkalimarinus sediminis]